MITSVQTISTEQARRTGNIALCGATDVPLALSSRSSFKRRVCASQVGCRKRQEANVRVTAAKDLGRAAGWREAIEALRASADKNAVSAGQYRVDAANIYQPPEVTAAHAARADHYEQAAKWTVAAADFLESLAPKETP